MLSTKLSQIFLTGPGQAEVKEMDQGMGPVEHLDERAGASPRGDRGETMMSGFVDQDIPQCSRIEIVDQVLQAV